MPFIPCGFTPAKRANRDTDARQVHENTGASRARALFLSASPPHTDEFTGQVGGLTWTEMNTRWDQQISSFNCSISLIDIPLHLHSSLTPVDC